MASSYNTRSTKNTTVAPASPAPGTTASSITIERRSSDTAMSTTQLRHYCIALTNNPRMLRGQEQALRDAAATRATAPVSFLIKAKMCPISIEKIA